MNIIPIQKDPYYKFDIVISDSLYSVEFMYNTRAGYWTISISKRGVPVVSGVPMLTVNGMFDQYVIGLDGIVPIDLSSGEDPNIDNIKSVVLFMLTDEELNATA